MTRKTLAAAATVAALLLTPLAIRYGRQIAAEAHQVYLDRVMDDRMRRMARLRSSNPDTPGAGAA